MYYKSVSTTLTDPYRAGCEIGESLKDTLPEVILLFASIIFEDGFGAFFEGLYDSLESKDVIVFGGTGDGVYETSLTAHYGVCALGISSNGHIRWSVATEPSVGSDSYNRAKRCANTALEQLGENAEWAFVLADGLTADGTGVVAGVSEILSFPFIGGMTGDDRKFTRSRILYNNREIEDGVAILLATSGMPFITNSASGFVPIGTQGIVEDSQGKTIQRISGQTSLAFIKEQVGKSIAEADLGILALATYVDVTSERFIMRASFRFDMLTGAITTFGSIPTGATIRVSGAGREQLLHAVKNCVESVMLTGFIPAAAIITSCAGRKWELDSCGEEEVQAIQDAIGHNIPLIGFPSFGEIGPFLKEDGTYTESFFHNATIAICLLGA
ncbi:MAG: FIST N-terminal domain-containing protein [Desulfuromonadaceae bacterium]|nr:FIST N-terminal domain-containing protein [Desulfuromonadaceae bacterium]